MPDLTLSSFVDTFLGSANQAAMQSAIGVSPTINTPKVYYVEMTGDNATAEVGNPAKPYQTAQAAYNAGVIAAVDFVLKLGFGAFSIDTDGAPISSYLKAVFGIGYTVESYSSSPTQLTINTNYLDIAINTNGMPGPTNPTLYLSSLYCKIISNGQSVNCDDGIGGYTAGDGGSITVVGDALWSLDTKGGSFFQSNGEDGYAGSAGPISIEGGIAESLYCVNGEGFFSGNPVPPSVSGNITLRHVDAVYAIVNWDSVSKGNVTAGCSSIPLGVTLNSDKGGNSAW